jgi:hypothetical protein
MGEAEGLDVADGDGVSCADKIEIAEIETNKAQQPTIRVVMATYHRVVPLQGKRIGYRDRHSVCSIFASPFAIRRTVVTL